MTQLGDGTREPASPARPSAGSGQARSTARPGPGDHSLTAATAEPAVEAATAAAVLVKPRLRGWLHAAITPLAAVAGTILVASAPTTAGKVGGTVYLAAALLLFG